MEFSENFYNTPAGKLRILGMDVIQEEIIFGAIEGTVYTDRQKIFKVCDEETANHLYGVPINPVMITIFCPNGGKFKQDEKGKYLHNMKVHVDSIDDSSYGIWFNELPLGTLRYIREQLFSYLQAEYLLSGETLLQKAIEIGADPESKDYN